ncbi:MAG: Crp/Fnr family transcriptional regulator [Candidatus Aminicenantes bacterium]|nr:Crp/Fnr family transcriptional regulator [Candidatus Aminicenantes bacterium]
MPNAMSLSPHLRSQGVPKKIAKGCFLFGSGEKAEGFYYLLAGEVRAFSMDEQGREVEVVRLKAGDFLGEAVALAGGVYPVHAQAVRDSRVLYFDRRRVLSGLSREPEAARFFVELLARKCLVLNQRIEALGLRTVRQRIVQYLLGRCSGGGACLVELSGRKSELARRLGTIPETLSRNLRQMQEDGLIEVRGRRIRILDCPRLRAALVRGK